MREISRLIKKWSNLRHYKKNDSISQLGMMVIAVGLSSYNVALFHLINHAFFVEGMKNLAICWKSKRLKFLIFRNKF
jgi:hypothetical protein